MTPDMLIWVSFNLNDEILGDFFFCFEVKIFRNRTTLTKFLLWSKNVSLVIMHSRKKCDWVQAVSREDFPRSRKCAEIVDLKIFLSCQRLRIRTFLGLRQWRVRSWFYHILRPYPLPDRFYRWILSFFVYDNVRHVLRDIPRLTPCNSSAYLTIQQPIIYLLYTALATQVLLITSTFWGSKNIKAEGYTLLNLPVKYLNIKQM